MALAHGLVMTFQDYWLIVAACVLQGVSFGVSNAQSPAIMYEAAGLKRYPEGMALANVMYGFGNLGSNIFGGKCFYILMGQNLDNCMSELTMQWSH